MRSSQNDPYFFPGQVRLARPEATKKFPSVFSFLATENVDSYSKEDRIVGGTVLVKSREVDHSLLLVNSEGTRIINSAFDTEVVALPKQKKKARGHIRDISVLIDRTLSRFKSSILAEAPRKKKEKGRFKITKI
jgi:hypothetical protein